MTTSLDQLPEELLLTIGDHLPNQPLRPCSRGLQNVFHLPVRPKWRQYDPQRVRALWKGFRPIDNERCYDLVLLPFEAYCAKHGCKLDVDGTPSIRTLETADSHEETLHCRFDPLDSPGLQPDEIDSNRRALVLAAQPHPAQQPLQLPRLLAVRVPRVRAHGGIVFLSSE